MLQYLSDLHLEFHDNRQYLADHRLPQTADYLLIAGDLILLSLVGKHKKLLTQLCKPYKAVYWFPGNHEFYGEDLATYPESFCKEMLPNFFLVNNHTVELP